MSRSEGVRCRGDKEIQAAESLDSTPDTAAEERAYFQDAEDFGKGCEKSAGSLLAHVSTTDTARDMDLMRQVLGDTRMHYFGISYGTELGGVYAHLFPKNVGRLILDAVVDPSADTVGHAKNQARGFQRALEDYLKSTGQDPKRGSAKIADLLDRIDSDPLPTSDGRELTQSLAVIGVVLPLYSEQSWPALTSALEAAERGDGSELLSLADSYNERDPRGTTARRPTPSASYRAWTTSSGRPPRRRRSCCRSSRRSRPSSATSSAGTRPAGATTGRWRGSSTPRR